MPLKLVPRELAVDALSRAFTVGSWACAVTVLVLTGIHLVDVFAWRGTVGDALGPLLWLLPLAGALAALARWTVPLVGALFLVVGVVVVIGYQSSLLAIDPALVLEGAYLANRPMLLLVLAAPVARSLRARLAWAVGGGAAAYCASTALLASSGIAPLPPIGVVMVVVVVGTLAVVVEVLQRRQRDHADTIERGHELSARARSWRATEQNAVAVLHDTVLSDLAAVSASGDEPSERLRRRLRDDADRFERLELELSRETDGVVQGSAALVREYQWRGLGLEVSGDLGVLDSLDGESHAAAVGAVRAALDNVIEHARQPTAEVVVDADAHVVSVMVVDSGPGFDPDGVGEDRLGLRSSIRARVDAVGGSVRVFSVPGGGTSVVFSIPRPVAPAAVTPASGAPAATAPAAAPSAHQRHAVEGVDADARA